MWNDLLIQENNLGTFILSVRAVFDERSQSDGISKFLTNVQISKTPRFDGSERRDEGLVKSDPKVVPCSCNAPHEVYYIVQGPGEWWGHFRRSCSNPSQAVPVRVSGHSAEVVVGS